MIELWRRRDFVLYLAFSRLQTANANTFLGIVWWMLNPLLLAAVYFLVFGVIFAGGRRGDPTYLAYLLSGLFPFHFMSRSLLTSANILISQRSLVSNVPFPRLVLPISAIIESGVGLLASMVVYLAVIVPLAGSWPGLDLAILPLAIVLHASFVFGLGAALSVITVRVRDIGNLLPFLLRLWLYTSPIIWGVSRLEGLPEGLVSLVKANPMFSFIGVYRAALMPAEVLSVNELVTSLVWAAAMLGVGLLVFFRQQDRVTRYL